MATTQDNSKRIVWHDWGIQYAKVMLLLEQLNDAGMVSYIEAGGFCIITEGEAQAEKMFEICATFGSSPVGWNNPHQTSVLGK